MAYHVYTTEGWILRGTPIGEADKYFHILTRDLGVVTARARSVRLGGSKLSPALVDFSFSILSFVKGKYSWRLVGAKSADNTYKGLESKPEKRVLWVRFLDVLRQLIHEEEKDKVPYEITKDFYDALVKRDYSSEELKSLECLAMFYLLKTLGYIEEKISYKEILSVPFFDENSIIRARVIRKELIDELNRALSASRS